MSSDQFATQKADQIAHRFFAKFALVIHHARIIAAEYADSVKVDKWFNLETPDTDVYKDSLRMYRSISSAPSPLPPFEIQVLLAVPELSNNQVLVLGEPLSSRVRVDPTPTHILLESWALTFVPISSQFRSRTGDRGEVTLATVYKHGISLFRSLFALLRLLPAWQFRKRLRRRPNSSGGLGIEIRVRGLDAYNGEGLHILEFDSPISRIAPALPTLTHVFAPVSHPFGTMSLTVTYLTIPHFQLDTLESLLSSRFLDEGPDFTPTLVRNLQRESLSTSPGSLPMRTSLPRSPPSAGASVADRFVLPAGSRASFPSTSPRMRNVALPTLAGSTGSGTSSSRLSQEGIVASALPPRVRRESSGTGRSGELPSAPSPLPIRRPSIVQPFKSSTLSSGSPSLHSASTSYRHQSPLAAGPSLPTRPLTTASPTSGTRFRMYEPSSASPMGIGGRMVASPATASRPSPSFMPSSLSEKRSIVSALDVPARPKRYSSSFGHRYPPPGGAGSEGSAGSSERERKDSERVGSTSYLSTNTDDDDISMFVQDIDARRPLGRGLGRAQSQRGHERRATEQFPTFGRGDAVRSRQESPGPSGQPIHERERAISEGHTTADVPNALLMSQMVIDERLREMNEMFHATLVGMQRRTRTLSTPEPDVASLAARRERGHLAMDVGRRLPSGIREGSEEEGSAHRGSLRERSYLAYERRTSLGAGDGSGLVSEAVSVTVSVAGSDDAIGFPQYRRRRGGSATESIGSEEVLGKLELGDSTGSGRGNWRGRGR